MTNKKSLFKNLSIFLCLVPMLVLSLLCLVPNKKDITVAAADSVSNFTFVGSDFITTATSANNGTSYDLTSFISVNCSFTCNNGVYNARLFGSYMRKTLTEIRTFDYTSGVVSNNSYLISNVVFYETYSFKVEFSRIGNITNNINRVVFNSYSDPGFYYNTVTYYDNLDNSFTFKFFTWNNYSVYEKYMFEYRTYYINLDLIDNNTYYEAGYTDGYNQGVTDGSSGGYQEGYKAGQTIGYQNGYNAGVEHGGNYSFMGLIGAVIDAPVSAFTSLLNFELLGVNILGFISGLLTLALIIFIIKLCMGGK